MNRHPAVAGLFYPNNPAELKSDVLTYINNAPNSDAHPKAMILPHAGYIYSAKTASFGYRLLKNYADQIKRVILLGPSHRVAFYGHSVPTHSYFTTPLGDISVDVETIEMLITNELAKYLDEAHQMEHCLEVQLPFLQLVLNDFSIVPIVVGQSDTEQVSELINKVWGGEETLIIVSSDLSHYLSYDEARAIDQETAQEILSYNPSALTHKKACGATPIQGLLQSVQQHNLKASQLDLCNSGDTAGAKDAVVGYGAFAFE